MNRGDIVIVREKRSPASKARPCVIVLRDSMLADATKVTVCPLTTHLRGSVAQRPYIVPDAHNGLRQPSEIQVDWVFTHPVDRLGPVIGRIDRSAMEQVDKALRRCLQL